MRQEKNNEIRITTKTHSLFVYDYEPKEEKIERNGKTYVYKPNKVKKFVLNIGDFLSDRKEIDEIFMELEKANRNDILDIRINSRGGAVDEGLRFINKILEKFDSKNITTYIESKAFSMGAVMFSIAKKRVIYPYSEIMFHTYSGSIGGKSHEMEDRHKHTKRFVLSAFKDIVVGNGLLTKKEFKKMIDGKDFWFDSKSMKKRKMATHYFNKHGKLKKIKKKKGVKNEKTNVCSNDVQYVD